MLCKLLENVHEASEKTLICLNSYLDLCVRCISCHCYSLLCESVGHCTDGQMNSHSSYYYAYSGMICGSVYYIYLENALGNTGDDACCALETLTYHYDSTCHHLVCGPLKGSLGDDMMNYGATGRIACLGCDNCQPGTYGPCNQANYQQ